MTMAISEEGREGQGGTLKVTVKVVRMDSCLLLQLKISNF